MSLGSSIYDNVSFDIRESIELMKREVISMSSVIIFLEPHDYTWNDDKTQGTE